jgi:hypothetical protein
MAGGGLEGRRTEVKGQRLGATIDAARRAARGGKSEKEGGSKTEGQEAGKRGRAVP